MPGYRVVKAKWGVDPDEVVVAMVPNGTEDMELYVVSKNPGDPWDVAHTIASALMETLKVRRVKLEGT